MSISPCIAPFLCMLTATIQIISSPHYSIVPGRGVTRVSRMTHYSPSVQLSPFIKRSYIPQRSAGSWLRFFACPIVPITGPFSPGTSLCESEAAFPSQCLEMAPPSSSFFVKDLEGAFLAACWLFPPSVGPNS